MFSRHTSPPTPSPTPIPDPTPPFVSQRPNKNQAELTEEEDSSLFFVQLPTKLPRPLPAFQRGKEDASSSAAASAGSSKGKGKGKGKSSGERGMRVYGVLRVVAGSTFDSLSLRNMSTNHKKKHTYWRHVCVPYALHSIRAVVLGICLVTKVCLSCRVSRKRKGGVFLIGNGRTAVRRNQTNTLAILFLRYVRSRRGSLTCFFIKGRGRTGVRTSGNQKPTAFVFVAHHDLGTQYSIPTTS